MRKLAPMLATGMLLSTAVFADVVIKIPSTVISKDTAKVKAASGVSVYASDYATATISSSLDGTGGIKFDYAITAGTGSYKGAAGVLVPIDPTWKYHDLSAGDSLYFDIKADAAGGQVNVIIGSPHLDSTFGNVNAALQSNLDQYGGFQSPLKTPVGGKSNGVAVPTTAWQTVGMSFSEFVISPWYTGSETFDDPIATASAWSGASAPGVNIGSAVQCIQFQPLWKWNATGSAMSNGTGNFYVRNIKIKHASLYSWHNGVNCGAAAPQFQLDQFDSLKSANANTLGGYWFAFTDTNTAKPTDTATGASSLNLLSGKIWAPWKVTGVGLGAVRTTLEKNVGTTYHKYAGWADMGTNFGTDADGANLNVALPGAGMNAISFNLYLGSAGGILPDSLKWDADNLPYIIFKVGVKGVGDDVSYAVQIAADQGLGNKVCIDLDSLTQPFYYANAQLWDPTFEINQIALEAKIADQSDATIHKVGPVTFAVNDVRFYGLTQAAAQIEVDKAVGVKGGLRASSNGLRASYGNGLSVSFKVAGPSAQVEVVRLDGSKVASFKTASVASNLNLPVSLTRGTYLVTVRGAGKSMVAPISVTR